MVQRHYEKENQFFSSKVDALSKRALVEVEGVLHLEEIVEGTKTMGST